MHNNELCIIIVVHTKPQLIEIPSLARSPVAPVLLSLSEPARSTKWNLAFRVSQSPTDDSEEVVDSEIVVSDSPIAFESSRYTGTYIHVYTILHYDVYVCMYVCT